MAILLSPAFWAAIALAASLAWGGYEKNRADRCDDHVKVLDVQIAAMGEQIHRQNDAVDQLQKAGEQARQRAARAQTAAAEALRAAQPEIDALRARIAAATPAGKTCSDALNEIRGKR
jgi:outer membrane PBP1 activator LpoA protein